MLHIRIQHTKIYVANLEYRYFKAFTSISLSHIRQMAHVSRLTDIDELLRLGDCVLRPLVVSARHLDRQRTASYTSSGNRVYTASKTGAFRPKIFPLLSGGWRAARQEIGAEKERKRPSRASYGEPAAAKSSSS